MIVSLVTIIFYFSISWLVPWEQLSFGSTISSSYFFDFVYTLGVLFALKVEPKLGEIKPEGFIIRAAITASLAVVFCMLSIGFQLASPFKYLDNLGFKLLILAPVFEELVFRGAFYELLIRVRKISQRMKIILNGLLFSFSHSAALLVLPEEFHQFVYVQLFYTFPLGILCSKSRERTGSFIEAIILHLIFNSAFYVAISNYGL